jgi:hypothetical protein
MMTGEARAAWATAYHIYEEYVPQLRDAAQDNDRAAEIFAQALDRVMQLYENSDTGRIMAMPLYEMLENAFTEAQKRPVEREEGQGGDLLRPRLQAS